MYAAMKEVAYKVVKRKQDCDSRVLASEMVPSELLLLRPGVSSLYSEQD